MYVKIYVGSANCTACGKKHKKVFEIDGKPYGSSCAKTLLGRELTAPIWLYTLAEQYIQDYGVREQWIATSDLDSFEVNFWNTLPTHSGTVLGKAHGGLFESYVYSKTIKIGGKAVKPDWQHEIVGYIKNRYLELKNGGR